MPRGEFCRGASFAEGRVCRGASLPRGEFAEGRLCQRGQTLSVRGDFVSEGRVCQWASLYQQGRGAVCQGGSFYKGRVDWRPVKHVHVGLLVTRAGLQFLIQT